MAYDLEAEETTLFVNTPTDTAFTTVNYDFPFSMSIWRRFVGQAWTREDLIQNATSAKEAAELERKGKRTTLPLSPGQV